MKILTYSELKKLPEYKGKLSLKGYNTLVKAYNNLLEVASNKNLNCNMQFYGGLDNRATNEMEHICHTNACILGAIGLLYPVKKEYFSNLGLIPRYSYNKFQKDRLPTLYANSPFGISIFSKNSMWDYLFTTKWAPFQNTFYKGRQRILIVLSGNFKSNWVFSKSNNII